MSKSSTHHHGMTDDAVAVTLTRRGRLVLFGLPTLVVAAALLTLALFAAASLVNHAQASTQGAPGVEATEVTIAPGDTLWSIAAKAETQQDVQAVISQIAELNDLDTSVLQPGQTLYVPQP